MGTEDLAPKELTPEIVAYAQMVAGRFCVRWHFMRLADEARVEAVIIAWRALDTYDPSKGVPYKGYLSYLIPNRLLDYCRAETKHRCPIKVGSINDRAFSVADLTTTEVLDAVDARVTFNQVCRSAAIPERSKRILRMSYFEKMRLEEIAPHFDLHRNRIGQLREEAIRNLCPQVSAKALQSLVRSNQWR